MGHAPLFAARAIGLWMCGGGRAGEGWAPALSGGGTTSKHLHIAEYSRELRHRCDGALNHGWIHGTAGTWVDGAICVTLRSHLGESLKVPATEKIGGKSTLLDKSVFVWSGAQPQYGSEQGLRGNVSGVTKNGFPRSMRVCAQTQRNTIGIAIPHVPDSLISRSIVFVSFSSKNIDGSFATKCL